MLKGIHHILFDAATQLYSFKDSITWDDRLTDCTKDLANKEENLKERQLCKHNLII